MVHKGRMVTPQQRWFLLASTGFLLLSISPPAAAEVMDSLLNNNCTAFFLNEAPPQVPGILMRGQIQDQSRYKPICQTYNNERRFVTLYDTENKIPVFSAYKFRGITKTGGAKRNWMIEPQLEVSTDNKNMRVDKKDTAHQAANKDYTNTSKDYNRGHLYPVCHAYSKDDKESTCTLTNIVPQATSFNGGSWRKMEERVQCVLDKYCKNNNSVTEAFVVVGAQPSANNKLNDRVNIPEVLWTAFCCYSSRANRWLASAHWGANVDTSGDMQMKTLAELEQQLSTSGSTFEAFPGSRCPQHETVTEFYTVTNAYAEQCRYPEEEPTSTTSTPTLSTTLFVATTTITIIITMMHLM